MKIEWKTCLRLGISVVLVYICISYWDVVSKLASGLFDAAAPLIIGAAIAYVVNILMSRYEKWFFPRAKKKFLKIFRRVLCMILAFVTLIAIVSLVLVLIVPQIVDTVQTIIVQVPIAIKDILAFADSKGLLSDENMAKLMAIDWKSEITQNLKMLSSLGGNVLNAVVSTVSTVFSGVVTALISIIFSIYLLFDKERLGRQLDSFMRRYFVPKWYNRVTHVIAVLNESFRRYIIGQSIEAVILGVLCTIGMLIIGLPYATMIGALIGFTALIPIAGAYIGASVGFFLILMAPTGGFIDAVIFVIFIIVLQQLEGNLIFPKVVGSSVGISSLWVLAAITIGGGIMGIGGVLLSVPIAATIYRLIGENVRNGKKKTPIEEKPEEKA